MFKKIFAVIICIMLVVPTVACTKKESTVPVDKQALKMDTVMDLRVYGSKANEAIDAAYKRIDEIEQIASADIATSDVSLINNAAGKDYVKVHPEIIKMLNTAIKYSKLSDGAFDVTVRPLIKLWGIGTSSERLPSDAEIKALLPLVGYKNISINEQDNTVKLMKAGMGIDLGGIAKGFAADEVVKVFKKYGIKNALINLGGSSIYTMGQKPDGSLWSVAIQHPRKDKSEGYLGVIKLPESALSTSGDYERFFIQNGKRYHHIINPFTGYPADTGVMSDTIIIDSNTPDANMLADTLTKVTFVSGVEKGFKIINSLPGVSCMAETTDYKIYQSKAWNKSVDNLSPDFTVVK
jgi:FAD:protein FMN transferase